MFYQGNHYFLESSENLLPVQKLFHQFQQFFSGFFVILSSHFLKLDYIFGNCS